MVFGLTNRAELSDAVESTGWSCSQCRTKLRNIRKSNRWIIMYWF